MISTGNVHLCRRPRRGEPCGLHRAVVASITVFFLAVVGGCGTGPSSTAAGAQPVTPSADRTWMSGVFLAGQTTIEAADAFGRWRGRPTDVLEIQSGTRSWDDVVASQGLLNSLRGFDGLVVLTVPLIPADGSATLDGVAAGRFDGVFRQLAGQLADSGHKNPVVRVGSIANVPSVPWAATVDNAATYRAAARHVMGLLKQEVPGLRTTWDVGCGRGLDGTIDRTAALTRLYPGDDVTDIIGCVHFDAYGVRAVSAEEWNEALRLRTGVGLADVADFARQRQKQLAVPNWGLSNEREGGGDDPAFMTRMHEFFTVNADILAFESYYDDPAPPRNSAIWLTSGRTLNPLAAEEYRRLWSLG